MPLHTYPRRRALPVRVEGNQDDVLFTENSVARLLGPSFYGDTQVRLRKCILDDNLRRKRVCYRTKILVDVAVGSFRRHDRVSACSLAQRRYLRRTGTMPLHTCPRRCAVPLWVLGNQDEVLFAEQSVARLLGLSFYDDTRVRLRRCISGDNLRRKSVFHRAKIVVDAPVGFF